MATGESNTFVEPTAGTAINTARGHVIQVFVQFYEIFIVLLFLGVKI